VDVERLANGNTLITDVDGNRIIEVDLMNNIVWSYNMPGRRPYDAERLANGNTLIADTTLDQVIEVDTSGNIVWRIGQPLVDAPIDVERLPNGNTLICDYYHYRIMEVDSSLNIVWTYPVSPIWDAERLPNGNTLFPIAYSDVVREVDMSGTIVWSARVGGWPKDVERLAAPHIDATIDIDPDTLNLDSNGNWITAYVDFPTGYDVNDIDMSTVKLENGVSADWGDVQGTTQMIKFDRLAVQDLIGAPGDAIELEVAGKLNDGTPFDGKDTIRAIQH
jgi:hypothetical protein